MKLNYKRTILVGFAFFLICMFWQAYDTLVPLILTNKFGMEQAPSGFIMALDNILAIFMLPLFGGISDRTHTKFGKRKPFIGIGTIVAAVALMGVAVADLAQIAYINGAEGSLWEITLAHPLPFICLCIALFIALIAMSTFRSPAVALMPDVTPKPLRSKGNAIINLMGSAGGIIVLVLGILFGTSKSENSTMAYIGFLAVIAVLMLVALAVFWFTVNEPKWTKEAESTDQKEESVKSESGKLSKGELRSLLFILASVALWFMGYNAITSKYSVYAFEVLKMDYNFTLILAQAGAILAYLPVGMLASKIGRKKTILGGVVLLFVAFGGAAFMNENSSVILMNVLFVTAGIGWATINVNSFPMVVELSKNGNIGKYTGFYYTASMAAQILTPILSGALVDSLGWQIFFPYGAVFVALSFVSMLFVKHGDSKPNAKVGIEALDVGED